MAATSLELAANNLTQVEKLGSKTKVHLLAILKPSSEHLRRKTPLFAPEVFYREITYPLGGLHESNPQKSNRIPITAANGMTQSPQVVENEQDTPQVNIPVNPPLAHPPQHLPGAETAGHSPHVTAPPQAPQDTISRAGTTTAQSNMPNRENGRPREILSARDLRATRTFAILKMLNPGDNPWDLGSVWLNLETVMGKGFVDWLLPIRRSPCCNHEDSESQFRLGPKVDFLRASCYFIEPNDIRLPQKESEWIANEQRVHQPSHEPSLNQLNVVPMGDLPHDSQWRQG